MAVYIEETFNIEGVEYNLENHTSAMEYVLRLKVFPKYPALVRGYKSECLAFIEGVKYAFERHGEIVEEPLLDRKNL